MRDPGEPLYKACVTRVEKFLYKKLLKVSEAAHLEFFSLSYFYDRVVDLALLGTLMLNLQHSYSCPVIQSTTTPRMLLAVRLIKNV